MGLIDTDTGLQFGTGLVWLTGGIGQDGLVITSSTSAAALFLAEWGPYGMAMDFTDASIAIDGSTGVLDYNSQGTVSSTGALLGPGSKLTYSAPSLKFTEQADGYIAGQAHNLVTYSEDLSNAAWTKSAAASTTSTKFIPSAVSTSHYVGQSATTIAGATYVFTQDVKADGVRYAFLYNNDGTFGRIFDLQTGATGGTAGLIAPADSSITAIDDGYYRCSITVVAATTGGSFRLYGSLNGTSLTMAGDETIGILVRRSHLRRTPSVSTYVATTSAAVYDLPYVFSGGVRTGIMVEPAATNVHVTSNDLSSAAWTKRGITTATKNQTGPDGIANSACRIANLGSVAGVNDIYEAAYWDVRFTASQAITESFYLRKVTASGVLRVTNASTGVLYYSIDFSILGDDWERITPTHPAVTTGTMTATAGGIFGPSFLAQSGTLDFDIYCPQLETGTVATSPIITYGGSGLRVADNIAIATTLFPLSTTAETLYSGFTLLSTGTTDIAKLKPTSGIAEIFGFYFTPSSIIPIVRNGGSVSFAEGSFLSPVVGAHKYAMAAEVNNARGAVDGTLSIADTTSVTMPGTVNLLTLGAGNGAYGGSSPFLLSVLAYFPERKADATLQTLTTA